MSRRFLAGLAALTCGALLCCWHENVEATPVPVWNDKQTEAKKPASENFFQTTKASAKRR